MSGDLVRFHNVEFEIVDHCGEKWITLDRVAEALGYSHRDKLTQLMRRNHLEFERKTFTLNLSGNQGGRPQTVINYHGVIRAAFLATTKHSREFRDWAETVLYKVMTTGSYIDPRLPKQFDPELLTQVLNQINETLLLQGKMVQNLAAEVNDMREWRAQTFIPAQADNSYWPTPTERLKTILPSLRKLPAYFNRGGAFDIYCALRHAQTRGGLLSQRNRRSRGKMPDYVIQPCPENDQFLREALEVWLVNELPEQAKLKLLPSRPILNYEAPST